MDRAAALYEEADRAWKSMHQAVDAHDWESADLWASLCASAALAWVREVEAA